MTKVPGRTRRKRPGLPASVRTATAVVALACGLLGTPSIGPSAVAAPATSEHLIPFPGAPGVTYLCGPTSTFVCTTGGYSGTVGSDNDWWNKYYRNGLGLTDGHNCTRYAAYKLAQNGVPDPGFSFGHAKEWGTTTPLGTQRVVDQTPAVGAIAQWNQGDSGHVAYVEAVTQTYIDVTDDDSVGNKTSKKRIFFWVNNAPNPYSAGQTTSTSPSSTPSR